MFKNWHHKLDRLSIRADNQRKGKNASAHLVSTVETTNESHERQGSSNVGMETPHSTEKTARHDSRSLAGGKAEGKHKSRLCGSADLPALEASGWNRARDMMNRCTAFNPAAHPCLSSSLPVAVCQAAGRQLHKPAFTWPAWPSRQRSRRGPRPHWAAQRSRCRCWLLQSQGRGGHVGLGWMGVERLRESVLR